jgi:two-component system osmolarity sensor histidine kinase EnvZ
MSAPSTADAAPRDGTAREAASERDADRDLTASLLRWVLPRSLFGRAVMIIVTPLLLLQVVATWVFYDSHWETVTRRLAAGVAGDIASVVELMQLARDPSEYEKIFAIAREKMQLEIELRPNELLPNDAVVVRETLVDRKLANALTDIVQRPFRIDSRSLEKQIEVHLQLPQGVLRVIAPRRRLFSSTTYVFILWMVGTSLALFAVAALFMRSQVRPIRRLAAAADAFGKGHNVPDFKLEGADEVRQAGAAFNQMRERIQRQITQRTEMLAGVSHDLRTPLTRMKLELAMLPNTSELAELKADVAEMEKMVEGYLAFARGEGTEQPEPADLGRLLRDVVTNAAREGAIIELKAEGPMPVNIRPDAMRRCLTNLIANARRHARRIAIEADYNGSAIEVLVDDDGPGIPPAMREEVFKPFFRLDSSRNPATGGIGLGLTIARDVMRGHGGELTLAQSPLGGLRAVMRLPV